MPQHSLRRARFLRGLVLQILVGTLGLVLIGLAGLAWFQHLERMRPAEKRIIEPRATGARLVYPAGKHPSVAMGDGSTLAVRSILRTPSPMSFGDYVWNETGAHAGPLLVRVDLTRQMLSVFRGGDEIGSAVILYGADTKPTPTGTFYILQKDADYHSRTYDAPMPYMLRLTDDGVAIHGSHVRERFATHGCVGVPIEFAQKLFGRANLNDRVVIVGIRRKELGA